MLHGRLSGYSESSEYSYCGQFNNGLRQDSFIYHYQNCQIRAIDEFYETYKKDMKILTQLLILFFVISCSNNPRKQVNKSIPDRPIIVS